MKPRWSAGSVFGRALQLVMVATAVVFVAVAPSAAGVGPVQPSFSVQPGHFDPADPATRAYFKLRLHRRDMYRDTVIVSNNGSVPVRLSVYPVDGLTGQTSGA